MFKFIAICIMTIIASVAAKPGVVTPLGYSGLGGHLDAAAYASPYALPYAGYGAAPISTSAYHTESFVAPYSSPAFVAPYASSYNAHHVAHAASYPLTYAAPVAAAYRSVPVAAAYHAAPYQHAPLGYSHGHIVGAPGPAKLFL